MLLKLDSITKTYKKITALDNFRAELSPGIHALLGPNGSGKSTLINIITGNLKPDRGDVLYNNKSVLKMEKEFRSKIGYMPQYPGMYLNFTVEYFMYYMAALKDIEKHKIDIQIENVLKAVDLEDVIYSKIGTLSGGMKQRLCLAQATLGEPEIIILDEPTAGLDPMQRISIRNYISKIALHRIVIFATHVVSDIETIASDVIMLKKGKIIERGTPLSFTKRLEGHVWSIRCNENSVNEISNAYHIVNLRQTENDIELRIIAAEPPLYECSYAEPTLEDCYLNLFGKEN